MKDKFFVLIHQNNYFNANIFRFIQESCSQPRRIEYFILYSGLMEMALRRIEYFILYYGHMELAIRKIEYFILQSEHAEHTH